MCVETDWGRGNVLVGEGGDPSPRDVWPGFADSFLQPSLEPKEHGALFSALDDARVSCCLAPQGSTRASSGLRQDCGGSSPGQQPRTQSFAGRLPLADWHRFESSLEHVSFGQDHGEGDAGCVAIRRQLLWHSPSVQPVPCTSLCALESDARDSRLPVQVSSAQLRPGQLARC